MHRAPSQLDEGYSEETRSQTDSDMAMMFSDTFSAHENHILAMLLDLPAEARKREWSTALT